MSTSEWLPRWSCLNMAHAVALFVGVGQRAKFTKERWIHKTNCSLAFWTLLFTLRKCEDRLGRTIHDFCTQITKCHDVDGGIFENLLWTVINLSFNHYIKIKLAERHFSFFITIHNDFVFAHSDSSVLITIQNNAHVHMNFISQWPILSPPKIWTFPPESRCRMMPTFLKNVLSPSLGVTGLHSSRY